jgi:hypothetical protein
MMLFAGQNSPVLLEVHAEMLLANGSAWLGVYAWKNLVDKFPRGSSEYTAYRKKMRVALVALPQFDRDEATDSVETQKFEIEFAGKVSEANEFFGQIRKDEMNWIGEGKDPEIEYRKKYYSETLAPSGTNQKKDAREFRDFNEIIPAKEKSNYSWLFGSTFVVCVLTILAAYFVKRRR